MQFRATFFNKLSAKNLRVTKKALPLHSLFAREFSSAGLEHLPYKQRVGGSNPSTPTKSRRLIQVVFFFVFVDGFVQLVAPRQTCLRSEMSVGELLRNYKFCAYSRKK